jgi:1,2-phenylacetyl-CoA epoxidase catalytic subunit
MRWTTFAPLLTKRVVLLPKLLDALEHAADLVVSLPEEAGEHLHTHDVKYV